VRRLPEEGARWSGARRPMARGLRRSLSGQRAFFDEYPEWLQVRR
jgi:hypothetical protein